MSLKVWLPLNGNTKNYGLDTVSFSNSNVTSTTDGKIGSAYSFNGSSSRLYATYNPFNNQISYAAWVYLTNVSGNKTLACCRKETGHGFSIFIIGNKMRIDMSL